jgi:alpha-beta hydrolase superfamily lysophospholipase
MHKSTQVPRVRTTATRAAIALTSLLLASCAPSPPAPIAPAPAVVAGSFDEAWAAYVLSTDPAELQPGCLPVRLDPDPTVAYRGTVVMLHGYSACPQQFAQVAELLSEAGWRVLLPVLPGHGHRYPVTDADDYSDLPTAHDWQQRWDALASQINGMMTLADGERVLAGYSLGGTTSLYVNFKAPDLYDRHLLLAPFFEPVIPWLTRSVLGVALYVPGVRQLKLSSPTEISCLEKRAAGYAGICRFQVKHVGALIRIADAVWEESEVVHLDVPMQLIWTEGDRVVSNERIRDFIARQARGASLSSCHLGPDVPHQFLSKYDHPGRATPWMTAFERLAVGFIDTAIRQPAAVGQPSTDCDVPRAASRY